MIENRAQLLDYLEEVRPSLEGQFPEVIGYTKEELHKFFFLETHGNARGIRLLVHHRFNEIDIPVFSNFERDR